MAHTYLSLVSGKLKMLLSFIVVWCSMYPPTISLMLSASELNIKVLTHLTSSVYVFFNALLHPQQVISI